MTSVKKRITKLVVDAMTPGAIIWDTKFMGFDVRYQRRDKVFVYKCRIGTRQRWFTIGKYGQPWTIADAENRVKVIQRDIAKNLDPAAIRDERAINPHFGKPEQFFWKPSCPKGAKELKFFITTFSTA
jgi:Arm DNA-binding domain